METALENGKTNWDFGQPFCEERMGIPGYRGEKKTSKNGWL
jgi:hypothetical protein